MDLTGATYFFTLAGLSMAFLGFTSIVVVLHQSSGTPLSPFQILITKLFTELGLMATAFAMLAPTLALLDIEEAHVWRIASLIMLLFLVPWLVRYPFRRRIAAPDQKWPLRGYVLNAVGAVVVIALCINVLDAPVSSNPAPLAFATVFVLSYAAVSFFWTYAIFVHE